MRLVGAPLTEVAAATAFLTRVPVRTSGARPGAAAFGLVGAGLGSIAAVTAVLMWPLDPLLAAGAAVASLAILSGALHLDGLADTADGLAARPEDAERARKDPAVGAAGVVAVVLIVVMQVAAVSNLDAATPLALAGALVVAAAVSRSLPVVGALLPSSTSTGLGGWWQDDVGPFDAGVCVGSCILLAVLLPGGRLLAVVGGFALGFAVLLLVASRGPVSGDSYGAAVEAGFLGSVTGALL